MDEIDQVIAKLSDDLSRSKVSGVVIAQLVEKGEPAIQRLIQMLNHPDSDVAANAATYLGYFKDRRAVQPLIAALKHNEEWVATCAARTLGALQANEAADALIKMLTVRGNIEAARSLGWLREKRAVEPIIASMEKDELPRLQVNALAYIGDVRAIPALIQALQLFIDDRHIRTYAVEGLIKMGRVGIAALAEALKDGDSEFRSGALLEIEAYGDSVSWDELQPFNDAFVVCLDDEDEYNRRWAALLLANVGDKRAITPLRQLLSSDKEYDRKAAREALSKIGHFPENSDTE